MKLKDITTIHYEVCSCSVENLPFHIVQMQDLVALKLFVLKCHVRRPWRHMAPHVARTPTWDLGQTLCIKAVVIGDTKDIQLYGTRVTI